MKPLQQESITGNHFGNTLRVLVAEQEQAVRDMQVQQVFETLGVHADAVNTSSAVRKLLSTQNTDYVLAIVDTRLPDAPNGEVLESLREYQIPTIAVSSGVTESVADKLLERHVIDCVLRRTDEDLEIIADIVRRTLLNSERKIIYYAHNDFNRKAIREMLDIHRYTVIDVRSEVEVRRQLDNHRDASMVLIDDSVTRANELGLINSLRQQYRREDLGVIALCETDDSNRTARMLKAGANDVVSRPVQTSEFYYRIRQCVESVERVREIKFSNMRDTLTGVYNRDYLFDVGEKMYASAQRGDISLTLAMLQIDHFDQLTIDHGIEASNQILKTIAPVLQSEVRKNDVVARYNAGTFVALASNVGDHNAQMVLERIRQLIAKTPVDCGTTVLNITGSIGATTYPDESFVAMIGNAQESLRQALASGHNRVVVNH